MKYSKTQLRDFFNQMVKELRGDDDEILRDLRERYDGRMLEPTVDPHKLQGRQQLTGYLERLTPFIKSVLSKLD